MQDFRAFQVIIPNHNRSRFFCRSSSLGLFLPQATYLPRHELSVRRLRSLPVSPTATFSLHYSRAIGSFGVTHAFFGDSPGDFPCSNLARASLRGSVNNFCGLGPTLTAPG